MSARWSACLLAALAALLAGCGDDQPPTPTTASGAGAATGGGGGTAAPTTTSTNEDRASAGLAAGGSKPPSEQRGAPSVEQALEAVLTSKGTPEQACDTFVSSTFVARSYGGHANCLAAQAPAALADSIDVRSESGPPDRRRVVVVPSGGPYDRARVDVVVIASGGSYEVDSLDAHVPAGP